MQLVPDVSADDIDRLVARDFPGDGNEVRGQLADHDPRVQAAVLKLSEGDRERLAYFLAQAELDIRDVLAWAEYPEYLERVTSATPDEERRQVLERDWAQYSSWLGRR